MPIKLSHSGETTYDLCPRKYFLQYRENLVSIIKGSPLYIGVALDLCFNAILENHGKKTNEELIALGLEKFNSAWDMQEDKKLGKIYLAKNPDILYSKKDFEEGILTESDGELIESYFQQLLPTLTQNPVFPFTSGYDFFQHLRELSKNFSYFARADKCFYNYCCWLSVKRKAPFLIEAYVEQLLPHIEKVEKVQIDLSIKSEDDDEFVGVADFTVQLKPGLYGNTEVLAGEVIIADNKSSSKSYLEKSYGEGSVSGSSQLSKYAFILNQQGIKVTKGAYFVFVKELKQTKNKTCKSCGNKHVGGQTKTCDAKINKKRCGGEWEVEISYSVETRLVVETISEDTMNSNMDKVDQTIQDIRAEKFEPNFDNCDWQFGFPCSMREFCSTGCMDGLIKIDKKDKK